MAKFIKTALFLTAAIAASPVNPASHGAGAPAGPQFSLRLYSQGGAGASGAFHFAVVIQNDGDTPLRVDPSAVQCGEPAKPEGYARGGTLAVDLEASVSGQKTVLTPFLFGESEWFEGQASLPLQVRPHEISFVECAASSGTLSGSIAVCCRARMGAKVVGTSNLLTLFAGGATRAFRPNGQKEE
jgi:hypothetical protein